MNREIISNEVLKYILYAVFDNYNNLSKKIYIVIDEEENSDEILKKINQNTPYFMKKIISGIDCEGEDVVSKLKKYNKNLDIVNKDEIKNKNGIIIDILNIDFNKIESIYSYETIFVVDYILNLDEIAKNRLFKEIEKNQQTKNHKDLDDNEESDDKINNNLNLNDLYNLCIAKTLWKDSDDISKIKNWIYNVINPNILHDDLFEKMLKIIDEQLNNLNFDNYLHHILDKEKNKSLQYISLSSDLYKLILFEDILRVDYGDKCSARIDLDVEYIGNWWRENIFPLFKQKYSDENLVKQLQLEIKKNEILDFHGKNFERLKYKIIDEIEKEYSNEEKLKDDFVKDEAIFLEKKINSVNPKNISELKQIIEKTEIKYENNKKILKNYCSEKLIDILENYKENYVLKEIEQFIEDNKEYLNDKVYVYFEVCIQKEIQKLEQGLLNDVCDVKDLESLKELHNKLLSNGEFVKCEDLEIIIFRKMEAIIKTLNLAEINDEENIKIANSIYENTSSIELEDYPIVEILICRDINIDLNDAKEAIEFLRNQIDEIKEIILKNCKFNCDYYNMNIQINDGENYFSIKFRYLKDLIDYIKLKEGDAFLVNLKNINKDVQHKKRVFNKGNSEIIKEIDNFYLEKENAKS